MSSGSSRPGVTLAYVALGSNLGDRVGNVRNALNRLSQFSAGSVLDSSLWESAPVDCPPGSLPFINAAAAIETLPGETPESLLLKLKNVEREFGRAPKLVLNEPRPLDLDLIAFGDVVRNTPTLTLPHPRAHLRLFVLAPLAEIAPDLRLPGHSHSVREMLESFHSDPGLKRLGHLDQG